MNPQLHLDRHTAELGGAFTGRVVLGPNEDTAGRIRGLVLQLQWTTLGRGDTDRREFPEVRVPTQADGSIDSDWSVPVPGDEPISYHGKLMAVEWELTASLDVSRRVDPSWTETVVVLPRNGGGYYSGPHPQQA